MNEPKSKLYAGASDKLLNALELELPPSLSAYEALQGLRSLVIYPQCSLHREPKDDDGQVAEDKDGA